MILMVHIAVQQLRAFIPVPELQLVLPQLATQVELLLMLLALQPAIVLQGRLLNVVKLPNRYKVVQAEVVQH